MQPWLIGNTTIRNPFRLSAGLRVLRSSAYSGSLLTHEEQAGFWYALRDSGVVATGGSNADAGGRKWRAALHQLGFITYEVSDKPDTLGRDSMLLSLSNSVKGLSGRPYEITPNGTRLAEAQTIAEEYECFLRALVAYQIPSPLEPKFKAARVFAPLFIVLGILHALDRAGAEARISVEEMSSIVMFTQDHNSIGDAVLKILDYRGARAKSARKDQFDATFLLRELGSSGWGKQPASAVTYVDANFRYLKATGLFSNRGRGIVITPEKIALTVELASSFRLSQSPHEYLARLYNGATLPTDSAPEAVKIVHSLTELLRRSGREPVIPDLSGLVVEEVNQVRHRLELEYEHVREDAFAQEQRSKWEDVLKELTSLVGGGRNIEDAPARLEWAMWRAFLAIDTLVNKPWQSRRFRVDTDFLPIGTAPGGGPDTIFEFEDFVLVVEVTLTTSSRQEAAEGETVRRHIAMEIEAREAAGKEVLGLFVADKIDSNTAETFRHGTWFRRDDSKLSLDITPLTISQFARLFEAHFRKRGTMAPNDVREIVTKCRTYINREGPEWKMRISQEVDKLLQAL